MQLPNLKNILPRFVDQDEEVRKLQLYVDQLPAKTVQDAHATINTINSIDVPTGIEDITMIPRIFPKSETVMEGRDLGRVKGACEEYLKRSTYYSDKYPGMIFLVKRDVQDICKKYNLVFGPAKHYIDKVPPNNQKAIIDFERSRDKDDIRTHGAGSLADDYWLIAPRKEFDKWLDEDKETGELKAPPVALDPIVCAGVPGGFLVVTKWGPEADIPEVNLHPVTAKQKKSLLERFGIKIVD